MKGEKSGVTRTNYAPDFKADIIRMLISGKRVSEISETFGIGSSILFRWKRVSMMKSKSKSEGNQSEHNLKLAAEAEKLRKENQRLKEERDILKKALRLFSRSDEETFTS